MKKRENEKKKKNGLKNKIGEGEQLHKIIRLKIKKKQNKEEEERRGFS